MRGRWVIVALLLVVGAGGLALLLGGDDGGDSGDGGGPGGSGVQAGVLPRFSQPRRIDNPYLPLSRFTTCELRGDEGGARVRVVRRLLDRAEPFEIGGDSVGAAVVEDRAFEDGELVERTLDYFAQADDGAVYYLGEDVDDFKDGRLIGHGGSWRYGRDTDAPGVAMPAAPRVGDRWRFEDVPGITVESDTVVGRIDTLRVGDAAYDDVIRVRERLHPEGDVEHKLYAPGTGTVRELPPDGRVDLVGCS